MNIIYHAAMFAERAHRLQLDKYTKQPYIHHPAEVAGRVAAFLPNFHPAIATAWLHDTVEDTDATHDDIKRLFGSVVAEGVWWLTDSEEGNRETRKRLSRERLAKAPGWVQTVKVCDLIANTASIAVHDPKFAVTYTAEKALTLDALLLADPLAKQLAYDQLTAVRSKLLESTQ